MYRWKWFNILALLLWDLDTGCQATDSLRQLWSRALADNDQPLQRFVTRPDILAPKWNIQVYDEAALSPGYWFVAPYRRQDESEKYKWIGPLIYDQKGELIWSGAPMFDYVNTFDFRAVEVNGRQMASLIIHENDAAYILDETYRIHQTIPMIAEDDVPPWIWDILQDKEKKTNFHDFNVVDDGGRALMLTRLFENTTAEESKLVGYGGNCSVRWEGFKEVDLSTEETLFEWDAHDHITMDEGTFARPTIDHECELAFPDGWGITHFNSVDRFNNGDYLVSARHTSAIYRVSHLDGSIIWRLGGVKSDFNFIGSGNPAFSRQHHARVQSENRTHTIISLFDNAHSDEANDMPTNTQSRGLILALHTNVEPMMAGIVQEYLHPDAIAIPKRGSVQILPNNNVFVCWSEATAITEHAQNGTVLMEAHFPLNKAGSYRGYKVYPWKGYPKVGPDINATLSECDGNACTLVDVSWNGATQVAKWNVYRTDSGRYSDQLASSVLRSGFETRILLEGNADYVFVEAVSKDDGVLGWSSVCKATAMPVPDSSESLLRTNTVIAFLLGITSTAIAAAVIWIVRWLQGADAKYDVLDGSDDEGDSDLEEEDFEHLRLVDLQPGLYTDQASSESNA